MPCENCSAQFTVFKRKRTCCECDRYYCSNCLGKGSNSAGAGLCGACRILCTRHLDRRALDHLRVRDLQCFLHRQNISTRGCIEKEELISLVVAHVNSGNFKRRAPQSSTNEFLNSFTSIRDFTSNLNNVISSALDFNNGRSQHKHGRPGGSNRSNATSPTSSQSNRPTTSDTQRQQQNRQQTGDEAPPRQPELFTLNGERPPIIIVPEPDIAVSETETVLEPTTDCLEIEDLAEDAAEWEFIQRPANPLPQDSDVLLREEAGVEVSENQVSSATPERENVPDAVIDVEITANIEIITEPVTEPVGNSGEPTTDVPDDNPSVTQNLDVQNRTPSKRIDILKIKDVSDIECLTAKQLKELLVINRVDFKGCCERAELLERAIRLWREINKSREDLDSAPTEELCKICMDAPMECVMLECGHIATCITCGKQLNECPICRQFVVRVVRFFKS